MNKTFLCLLLVVAAVPALYAQTAATSLRQLTGELASGEPGGAITLPDAVFAQPSSTAAGKLQRGILLYVAAGRAREINTPSRATELVASAKAWLEGALSGAGLASNPSAASQCCYYLGMIAEHCEGVVSGASGAQARYEQALLLNPQNKQAAQALARVQFVPPSAAN